MRNQLLIAQFVERGIDAARGLRTINKVAKRLDHVARQAGTQRITRVRNLRKQTASVRLALKRLRNALRGNEPAIEVRIDTRRDFRRDGDLIRCRLRQARHRDQVAGYTFERNDLVAEGAIAGLLRHQARKWIFPVELLQGEFRRGLARLDGEVLEDCVTWQRGFFAFPIDAINRKPHATIRALAKTPGNGDDVIVCKGNYVLHCTVPRRLASAKARMFTWVFTWRRERSTPSLASHLLRRRPESRRLFLASA